MKKKGRACVWMVRSGDDFSYFSGVSAAGCRASCCWSEQPKRSVGCARSGLEIRRGHWAHPRTLLEGVRGTPHLGTRKSVLGRMRWLLQHSKRVREELCNNNNKIIFLLCTRHSYSWLHSTQLPANSSQTST